MNRETFLDRVRQAAHAGIPYRVRVEPVPAAGYVGTQGDICESLAAEINAVGGESHVVASFAEARTFLGQFLRQHQVQSAICWQHPVLEKLGLRELLAAEQIASHAYQQLAELPLDEQRKLVLSADVGISSADFAIAETGTLAVCARPGQERMISLVPPIHIAVIERGRILPDLFDLFTKLQERGTASWPSNIALISGPSKTGDIELELTTGVHGPGRWIVVIVRDAT